MNARVHYVKKAPECLIHLYESENVKNGKNILYKLLTESDMNNVWIELSNRVNSDKQWREIFQLILLAKLRSKKIKRFVSRKEMQIEYIKLSEKLKSLSQKIQGSMLDVLSYEFINEEMLSIIGLAEIKKYDALTRNNMAHKILPYWPSASEILHDMAIKASNLAHELNNISLSSDRGNKNLKEREFIFSLGTSLYKNFNEYMYGTIATITATIFSGNNPSNIDKDFVKAVLKKRGV